MTTCKAIFLVWILVLAFYSMAMPLPPGHLCGKFTPTPSLHNKLISSEPSGDIIVTESNSVSIFSPASNKVVSEIERPHEEPLSHVFAVPNNLRNLLITASMEGDAKVWKVGEPGKRLNKPEMLKSAKLFKGPVIQMAYHDVLDVIIALGEDGTLKIWNYNDGKILSTIKADELNKVSAIEITKYNKNTYVLVGRDLNINIMELSKTYELVEDRTIVPPVPGPYDILLVLKDLEGYFIVGAQMTGSFSLYNIGTKGDNPLDTKTLPKFENILGMKYISQAKALGVSTRHSKKSKNKESFRVYRVEDKKTNLNIYQMGAFTDFQDLKGHVIASGQMAVSETASKIYLLVSNGLKEYKITTDPVMATASGECYFPCPFGSNPEGDNCVKCHSSCLTCSGPAPSQCFYCKSGLFFFNSFCFEHCPNGALTHHGNKTCSCIPKYSYNPQGFCERKSLRPGVNAPSQPISIGKVTGTLTGSEEESEEGMDTTFILRILLPVGGVLIILTFCILFIIRKRGQNTNEVKQLKDDPSYHSPKNYKKFDGDKYYSTKEDKEIKTETNPDTKLENAENAGAEKKVTEPKEETKKENEPEEEAEPISLRHTKTSALEENTRQTTKEALNRSEPNLKPFIDHKPIYTKRDGKNQKKEKKVKRKLSDSSLNNDSKKKEILSQNPTLANVAANKKLI